MFQLDKPVHSLAQLFIALWLDAQQWRPNHRSAASQPDAGLIAAISDALKKSTEQAVLAGLMPLLETESLSKPAECGKILAVMRGLDNEFLAIHPRLAYVSRSDSPKPSIPAWLQALHEQRILHKDYGSYAEHHLIPRGPLTRTCREENAANADSLADQFAALAVVPVVMHQDGRSIGIVQHFLATDAARGIVSASNTAKEVVAFIPIAEQRADLVVTEYPRDGKLFVDFRLHADINAVDRLLDGLKQIAEADIVIVPELMISETDADSLAGRLSNQRFRIMIAGSGHTEDTDEGLPWNESRIFNRSGTVLWRQRKLWPAGLDQTQAEFYGLSNGNGLIMEKNAAGDEIMIVDSDSLGRCVVLICQDIEINSGVGEILRQFQPDWVFIPILDHGINTGGWIHQRTFALSDLSQARFLVASTVLPTANDNSTQPRACGLAVGPKFSLENGKRPYLCVSVVEDTTPGYATITWGGESVWQRTTVK